MLDARNITPRQIAAINALTLSVMVGIASFIYTGNPLISLVSFALLFLLSYLLITFFTERFIYRQIKLIYKLIAQTKATKRESFFYENVLPEKNLSEVTEEVEQWAEQKRMEIDRLQENEKYRKEFLQNLSHELKTPIFAIQGYVDTLLSGAMNNEETRKRFLQNASRNIDRLVNLVDDLDEISKLESGEQLLYKESFIIQDLMKDVFEALSLKSAGKQIQMQFKKGSELPMTVYADKEKIRQVLINLIDNAIKYGKQNGTISFSAYKADEGKLLIEISDDGAGISEEHLPRIFERFYRTDLARSRKEGGSGLGLSICKHIIEAHGEHIHVRSTPDIGTTFGFLLPEKGPIA
ncbi:MAG: sensor histidine kinase [Bacteroidetes bacterium]|nr:sensor histidine kinase [Bacteroidota bacterium]